MLSPNYALVIASPLGRGNPGKVKIKIYEKKYKEEGNLSDLDDEVLF